MEKVDSAGIVTGVVFLVLGASLLVASFFLVFIAIYAIISIIIGVVILATLKEQEAIEPIRKRKN